MDILEKHGIKIPNSVLVKFATSQKRDDEVVDFLSQYGNPSQVVSITESGCIFDAMIIVEFDSGNALVELRKILPYTYVCHSEKVTYDISELSAVCSEFEGKLKTQTYLSDLKNLAKLTGQDYAEVLKEVMSLMGQSIHELSDSSEVKTLPDVSDGVMPSVPSTTPPAQLSSAALYGLQVPESTHLPENHLPAVRESSRAAEALDTSSSSEEEDVVPEEPEEEREIETGEFLPGPTDPVVPEGDPELLGPVETSPNSAVILTSGSPEAPTSIPEGGDAVETVEPDQKIRCSSRQRKRPERLQYSALGKPLISVAQTLFRSLADAYDEVFSTPAPGLISVSLRLSADVTICGVSLKPPAEGKSRPDYALTDVTDDRKQQFND
ncbi:hypothetical protein ABVT39_004296 [Epinephelus coioides]